MSHPIAELITVTVSLHDCVIQGSITQSHLEPHHSHHIEASGTTHMRSQARIYREDKDDFKKRSYTSDISGF